MAMTQRHIEALQEKERLLPVKGTPFKAYESDGKTWSLRPPDVEE